MSEDISVTWIEHSSDEDLGPFEIPEWAKEVKTMKILIDAGDGKAKEHELEIESVYRIGVRFKDKND